MKNINKSLSLVLVFVLMLSVFPFNTVYAVTGNTENIQTQQEATKQTEEFALPDIVTEEEAVERGYIGRSKTEEKDNYTFVFKNSDNTRTMRVYSHPVKYTDKDGNIKDITLDIQARDGGGFETKDNSIKTTFGNKLSDGIRLQHESVDIKLIPANKNISSVLSEDNKTVSYTLDTKTSLEYSLTYMGFKEDIVVKEYTGQTEYEFLLYTNGLTVKEEMGSFFLADAEGNRKANIGDIIIFTADERNNTLGALSCEEIKENQIYRLTIHIDAEYLKDEKTVYPIRIDPTLEITSATTEGAIEDVTVQTNATYSGTLGILYLGTSNNRKYRVLMRFPNLDLTGISASQITNATVEFRDVMCQSVQVAMECRYFIGSATAWSESGTTTWSSIGGDLYVGSLIDTKTIFYGNGNEGSDINRYSFNITNAAKSWANGVYSPKQGFIFKAADESFSSTEDRLKYFGSYNRSDYRTSFTLQYTDYTPVITLSATSVDILEGGTCALTATTTPAGATVTWSTNNTVVATVSSSGVITAKKSGITQIIAQFTENGVTCRAYCTVYVHISDGIYYFNNVSNNYRIEFFSTNSYKENSLLYAFNSGTAQPTYLFAFFKVNYLGKGLYSIRSMLDNKMGWTRSSASYVVGTTIGVSNATVPNAAKWYIKYDRNGYYIHAIEGVSYTVTSSSTAANKLTLSAYSSANTIQRWALTRMTASYHGVNIRNKTSALAVDDTYTFTASVYSTYTSVKGQNGFTWSVTNGTGTATINSSTGKLTGVSPGTVTVKVMYNGHSSWYDEFEVEIIPIKEGDYYFKNRDTLKYMQPDDNGDTHTEQHDFDASANQRWQLIHHSESYYYIVNGATGKYLTAPDNSTAGSSVLTADYSSSIENRQLWSISKISGQESYKIQSKNQIGGTLVLAVGWGLNWNGINVEQKNYSEDDNYKDEWALAHIKFSSTVGVEGQQKSNWCWVTSARMYAKHSYSSVTYTQAEAVIHVKGSNVNEGGNRKAAQKAINYYISNITGASIDTVVKDETIYSEDVLVRFLDDGHVIYIARGWYSDINDPESRTGGHATLIYGYTLIGSEVWFLVRDPWPVNEGETYMISYEKLCNGRNCKSEEDADTGVWYASIVPNTSYVNDTIPHYFDQ